MELTDGLVSKDLLDPEVKRALGDLLEHQNFMGYKETQAVMVKKLTCARTGF
jgi:hypothetical protein